jgi:hypothetical protein
MRIRTAFAYALVWASLSTQAQAQDAQPPSDTDLKAAYCIGVAQQTLTSMPAGMPDSLTAAQRDRLQHLQAYLVPRMQYVDPLGLGAARARGQIDEQAVTTPDMVTCSSRCFAQPAKPASDPTALKQCVQACDTEHRLPRLWTCADLSWLPF